MTVYLVGAGPGDPGLLTVRGAEVLASADVVVHDRLAEATLLDQAPATAERIDVGKSPGSPVHQDDINALLVTLAGQHQSVVRLKGGDPFVFGRGGEEALALTAAGIPFEVIPGITSVVAVPAYAGVPVTHRGLATSFTVVTGHTRAAGERDTNWEALAAAGGTIVVLMGVAHRRDIADRLIAGGLDPATPVTAVQWGTRPEQVAIRTTLAELGDADIHPPSTMVIGAVAGLDLAWYAHRPLLGRQVVVTRARAQASGLVADLAAAGARTVEVPTIAVADPDDGGAALGEAAAELAAGHYAWVVLTSVNAVERLWAALRHADYDARDLAGTGVAAIGPGTASALADRGIVADLVPERSVAEGLLAEWPSASGASGAAGSGAAGSGSARSGSARAGSSGAAGSGGSGAAERGRRVLLPRAAVGRDVLPAGLRAAGWEVDVVEAYRTVPEVPSPAQLAGAAAADAICFTSSSTVTNYLSAIRAAGPDADPGVPPVVVCMGPATADTARAAGLEVTAVADPHTLPGLVDTVIRVLGRG